MLSKVRWGAVLMGAVSGLFVMVLLSLLLFLFAGMISGELSDAVQSVLLAFALFLAQMFAGYVGGRLTSADQPAFHGAQSGLALYGIITVLTLSAGSPAGAFTIVFFALVAVIVGYAGGLLGGRPREE